ncbi:Scr1 family TA system antitoxin-like transcriptional regulator [Streptomyces sp. NPDC047315]|uniref:Scr1 family TA system antitoxin-like transcriptional regulator n=1 Tax=Streptomyces sp. NPDC047315 TaxID=3155142 RepID=UPI0033C73131
MGGVDVMRAQLRRVLEAMGTPGLTLGVIPARAPMAVYPSNSFSIFDGARVEIEPYSSAESITEPLGVALYERVFSLLRQSAVYGQGARELVEAELTALG